MIKIRKNKLTDLFFRNNNKMLIQLHIIFYSLKNLNKKRLQIKFLISKMVKLIVKLV